MLGTTQGKSRDHRGFYFINITLNKENFPSAALTLPKCNVCTLPNFYERNFKIKLDSLQQNIRNTDLKKCGAKIPLITSIELIKILLIIVTPKNHF